MNYTEDIDDDSDSIFFDDPLDEVEESAEDYHDELNPKLWDNMKLKPEVKNKLNEIAKAFIDYLDINDDAIEDIVITGSSAGYNYTPYSDLDLHLVIDYDKVHEDCPIVEGFLWSMKAQFNKDHDISIYGIPVELYAEQSGAGTIHNGLYSLMQNRWIDEPKKIVPPDNDAAVEAKYNELKEAAEKIEDSEVAKELLNKIYTMRKAGLAQGGELSTENLAFKKLRNDGTIEKLKQMEKEQIDKELSLEDFSEDPLDEVEDEQIAEDNLQLNLFKDKIAEQTERDYKQFIYGYPNRIADYLNRAYSSIVKNMPATEAQKKATVCRAADFDALRIKDGTAQVNGWECKLGKDLHALSLDKAIASAIKSKENKYEGKEFCLIRTYDDILQFWVNKELVDKVNKAMHINKSNNIKSLKRRKL